MADEFEVAYNRASDLLSVATLALRQQNCEDDVSVANILEEALLSVQEMNEKR